MNTQEQQTQTPPEDQRDDAQTAETEGQGADDDGGHVTFTDEDLNLLSVEERAALKEQEEAEEAAQKAEEAQAKEREAEQAQQVEQQAEQQENAAAAEAQRRAEEAQAAVPDTSAHETEIEAVKTEFQTLRDNWKSGELSEDEYFEQEDALMARREAANIALAQAESAREAAQRAQQAAQEAANEDWYNAVDSYVAAHEELADAQVKQAWGQLLQSIDGNDDYASLSDQQKMELAHQYIALDMQARGKPIAGPQPATPAPSPQEREQEKASEQDEDKPQGRRPEAPPTLASVPATDVTGQQDGRYAQIDRQVLSGDPYAAEDALASMSDAERERYLRANT